MSNRTPIHQRCALAVPLVLFGFFLLARISIAEDAETESANGVEDVEELAQVLATVDGVPIQLGEVRQELQAVLSDRQPDAAGEPRLVQEMLQQIVHRRLALASLVADRRAASEQLVQSAVAAHRQGFEERGESLDEFLRQNGVPIASFQQRLRWEISWAAYKEAMLTDENLEQFFQRYRRHFDGTEVQASHILLRGEGQEKEGERAREIRATIVAGDVSFAAAAAKFSDAPSKDRGGDIGFFPRRGVMHEAFAAAAFALQQDEISQPVVTPFGMHLIQVTAEKPGNKTLTDVREDVYRAAEARLFDALVANGHERSNVEYAQ